MPTMQEVLCEYEMVLNPALRQACLVLSLVLRDKCDRFTIVRKKGQKQTSLYGGDQELVPQPVAVCDQLILLVEAIGRRIVEDSLHTMAVSHANFVSNEEWEVRFTYRSEHDPAVELKGFLAQFIIEELANQAQKELRSQKWWRMVDWAFLFLAVAVGIMWFLLWL